MEIVVTQDSSTQLDSVRERELAYYENLYSTVGVGHFAKPAVVAFRDYLVRRILRSTGAGRRSRVLSIGCGIGDLELLLAPHVAGITGVDLSPAAIAEANRAAQARNITNVRFLEGAWQTAPLPDESFDLVLAIFFLHHLPDDSRARLRWRLNWLTVRILSVHGCAQQRATGSERERQDPICSKSRQDSTPPSLGAGLTISSSVKIEKAPGGNRLPRIMPRTGIRIHQSRPRQPFCRWARHHRGAPPCLCIEPVCSR